MFALSVFLCSSESWGFDGSSFNLRANTGFEHGSREVGMRRTHFLNCLRSIGNFSSAPAMVGVGDKRGRGETHQRLAGGAGTGGGDIMVIPTLAQAQCPRLCERALAVHDPADGQARRQRHPSRRPRASKHSSHAPPPVLRAASPQRVCE